MYCNYKGKKAARKRTKKSNQTGWGWIVRLNAVERGSSFNQTEFEPSGQKNRPNSNQD